MFSAIEHQLLINPFTHRRRRLVNERVRVVNNLRVVPPLTCPKVDKSCRNLWRIRRPREM